MSTHRVLHLYQIKSNALRRTVIALTFPCLMGMNLLLWIVGSVVLAYRNQIELFRSAVHYWKTSDRIEPRES